MKYICCVLLLLFSGCSSLGFTNEDAGHSVLASDVSVPANGNVTYIISRNPRTDGAARQYNKDMNVSRSYFSWFSFKKDAGKASSHIGGQNGS
jgi:hypothetical protein